MASALALRLAMPMGSPTGGGPHPVAPWLLQTGVWNDAGVWLDASTWTEWLLNGGTWSDIGVWADTLTWDDGTPSFDAGGVNFDGATWLRNAGLVATDSANVSGAFWFRTTTDGPTLWVADPENNYDNSITLQNTGGPVLSTEFSVSGSGGILAGNTPAFDSAWHSCVYSADVNFDGPDKILKVYIDGVDATLSSPTNTGPPLTLAFNALSFWVGNDGYDDQYIGDLAEFWFAPNQSLLVAGVIPPATIAKFYSGGHPVDLGADGSAPTGTAPAIYMHRSSTDAASAFATNLGTGGSFTTTGTLTASSTNP